MNIRILKVVFQDIQDQSSNLFIYVQEVLA